MCFLDSNAPHRPPPQKEKAKNKQNKNNNKKEKSKQEARVKKLLPHFFTACLKQKVIT